jgi:multisubunit Na+/H+ antiporter MnhC subunit
MAVLAALLSARSMPAPTALMITAVIIALGKSNAKLVAIVKANSLEIF